MINRPLQTCLRQKNAQLGNCFKFSSFKETTSQEKQPSELKPVVDVSLWSQETPHKHFALPPATKHWQEQHLFSNKAHKKGLKVCRFWHYLCIKLAARCCANTGVGHLSHMWKALSAALLWRGLAVAQLQETAATCSQADPNTCLHTQTLMHANITQSSCMLHTRSARKEWQASKGRYKFLLMSTYISQPACLSVCLLDFSGWHKHNWGYNDTFKIIN